MISPGTLVFSAYVYSTAEPTVSAYSNVRLKGVKAMAQRAVSLVLASHRDDLTSDQRNAYVTVLHLGQVGFAWTNELRRV